VAELAVSAVLLVGSGLLLRSLIHLAQAETGVRPEGVLAFRVSPPQAGYPTSAHLRTFYTDVLSGIARLPGVEATGAVSVLPFTSRRMYEFTLTNSKTLFENLARPERRGQGDRVDGRELAARRAGNRAFRGQS
jgi:hypothetical protein